MFTGLIESTGKVISLTPQNDQGRLIIDVPFAQEVALGDSIAVNGCCLTVAEFLPEGLAFDLLSQTLHVTALGKIKTGDIVNLERAMSASARFGGHLVQGHIDTTGFISAIEASGSEHRLTIALPPEIRRLCLEKGSLTIDGISLTIAHVLPDAAQFYIIPHTWQVTHLQYKKLGEAVNLEADYITKTIDAMLEARRTFA